VSYAQAAPEAPAKAKETLMKSLMHASLVAAALATCLCAQAQTSENREALYVKSLAATCAQCHGTQGKAVDGSAVTSLAGLPKDYFLAQMAAFKSGARPATIMHQLSKGYSDAQIEQMATYFAAQKK
jgi:cytochrome subunit of sulfide dehydrogenase